jgi:methionine-gamma-lyase
MGGRNPIEDLAHLRHEFGEHGGVNMSVEASSTFTVIDPETVRDLFQDRAGSDKD